MSAYPIMDRRRILRACADFTGGTQPTINGNTQLVFSNIYYNIGGMYNKTTGLFTCPFGLSGVYYAQAMLAIKPGNGVTFAIGVWKNGANNAPDTATTLLLSTTGSTQIITVACPMILDDLDTVYFNAFCSSSVQAVGAQGSLIRIGNS